MGALARGETIRGSIDVAGARTIWTLEGEAEELLFVQVEAVRGSMVPFITVYDSNSLLVAASPPSESDATLSVTLPDDDTYQIVVSALGDDTGLYQILAYGITAGGGELAYGDTVEGTILGGVTEDIWHFRAEAGDFVDIEVQTESEEVDFFMELLDPDETLLASDDDSGDDLTPSLLSIPIGEEGRFTIRVAAFESEQPGPYELTLRSVKPSIVGALTLGEAVTDTLEAEPRLWTFEGVEGQRVSIAMNALSDTLDPKLSVYSPEGVQLATDDDSGGNFNARITLDLPASGLYSVFALPYRGSGSYTLLLQSAEPLIAGTLAYGATGEGILEPDQEQAWLFDGTAGDLIEIAARTAPDATTLDLQLTLLDSDGAEIAFDDDSGGDYNPLLTAIALPADGAYTILVSAYAGDGAYLLDLRRTEP